jgi:periplasmic divalent cation tolerance protein
MPATEAVVVLVTAPSAEKAADIARQLVEEKLAACGNVLGAIRSIYAWQGQVHDEPEALLVLKAPAHQLAALTERVRALHPYELPEIIALPIVGGHAPYVEWILRAGR